MSTAVKYPLANCRPAKTLLRQVNEKSEEFLGLVDSVKTYGIQAPPVARMLLDEKGEPALNEKNEQLYEIIDGLHRMKAAIAAGLSEIPLNLVVCTDDEVSIRQIVGNIHRVETKPHEYSQALKRAIEKNPTLTKAVLAAQCGKSTTWIDQRLSLTTLHPDIGKLLDEGKINLINGYALSKLPIDEQTNWISRAMTTLGGEFVPLVEARKKEIEKARREGRDTTPAQFVATPFMQKQAVVLAEIEKPDQVVKLLSEQAPKSLQEAAVLILQWFLNIDPLTVAARKADYEEKQRQEAEEKAKAKAERDAKKQRDAAVRQARTKLQVEGLNSGKTEEQVAEDLKAFDERQARLEAEAAAAAAAPVEAAAVTA